jgi:hypothetical protein
MLRGLLFASAFALLVPLAFARAEDTPPTPPPPPPVPAPAPGAAGDPPAPAPAPAPAAEPPAPAPAPGAPAAPPAPAPSLVPEPAELDFGIVSQNQVLDAQFTLKNVGPNKIHIHKPIADCGCYQATLEANDVAPGGAVVVKVKFDTGTWSGGFTKKLRIMSDDAVRSELILPIKMNIVAGVVLDPGLVLFGDVLRGEKPSKQLLVKWFKGVGQPFNVTKVEIPEYPDGFDVVQEPFENDKWKGTKVTLTFREPPKLGQMRAVVIVRTDAKGYERIDVTLQGYVSGHVWVQEREVNMGWVGKGQTKTRPIRVKPLRKGTNLGKVSARSKNGRVQVEAIPDTEARPGEWMLQIRVPADAPKGKLEDVIEILTEVPGEEITEIKVRAEILG